jgi:hypothetical protein
MGFRRLVIGLAVGALAAGGVSLGAAPAALAACSDAPAHGVDWSGCDKSGGTYFDLSFMDLSGADFSDTNLYYGYVWGSNLTNANFTNSFLVSLRLWEANLTSADFSGSDLTNAIFTGAFVDCGSRPVLGTGIVADTVYDLPEGWTITDGTLTVPVVACAGGQGDQPIPAWVQAYARGGADAACESGWDASWQSWAEPVTGGWVCTRSIPSLG